MANKSTKPPIDFHGMRSMGVDINDPDPANWRFYKGRSWVHRGDWQYFEETHREDCFTGMWHKKAKMGRVNVHESPNGRDSWTFLPRLLREGWRQDHNGSFLRSENSFQFMVGAGCFRLAHNAEKDSFFRDEVTEQLAPKESRIPSGRLHSRFVCVSKYAVGRGAVEGGVELVRCDCDHYFDEDRILFREVFMRHMCDACFGAATSPNVILPYSCRDYPDKLIAKPSANEAGRPNHVFRSGALVQRRDIRLFGVEAEVEMAEPASGSTKNRIANSVLRSLGSEFAIIKSDGSLDNGFEIVSAPACLETHRRYWPKLDSMPDKDSLRAWDTSTCGFHVHVGKDSLTTLQVGRIIHLINHPANKSFVQKVAGRSSDRWSKFINKKLSCAHPNLTQSTDKYEAVNTLHRETIEFRIFRGTINTRHIIRNLEFVDAVCQFCLPSSRSFKELAESASFIRFCVENRKAYPLLNQWYEHHGMVQQRKLGPGIVRPVVDEPAFNL